MMFGLSRNAVFAIVGLLLIWSLYLGSYLHAPVTKSYFGFANLNNSPLSPHVHNYFDQAFSAERATNLELSGLKAACARTEWKDEHKDVYLQCGGMSAGMTSIMSQVKVCLKMAVDAGVNIILPSMPLRDSNDLLNFNFFNDSAYHAYDAWFDQEHLISSMTRACPRIKFRHPEEAGTPSLPVAHRWYMDIASAPGFQHMNGYFWVGRPFKAWFDQELRRLRFVDFNTPKTDEKGQTGKRDATEKRPGEGITILDIASQFLLFRITDDATGRELALWNDLAHTIRFKEEPRMITNAVLSHIDRPFYGVHFRAEKDNMWSPMENQLKVDLDALDKAWEHYGSDSPQKPLVYLACGDESQVAVFTKAALERGWMVTSKYSLLKDNPVILNKLTNLPFDFQGAVDMGVMIKSHFFLGITGSAFSSTVAHMRDSTGRYRGSSLQYPDDDNARTHLFNDGDASHYPCCL